jgi:integrase
VDIMTNQLTTPDTIGLQLNQMAARNTFHDYMSRKAERTVKRQRADLNSFAEFLATIGIRRTGNQLQTTPRAWRGMTWGIVDGYIKWLLAEGYAVTTVNLRRSTVRTYARLAARAGGISAQEYQLIKAVDGYSHREALRIDEQRRAAGMDTRRGHKKLAPVRITPRDVEALKDQPLTNDGFIDTMLITILCDHGLRISEIKDLKKDDFDLAAGCMVFYRRKVDKWQTHELSPDTLRMVKAYIKSTGPTGLLFDMSTRTMAYHVKRMGEAIGIDGLSPHDCRHYWATQAARTMGDPFRLQEAGGWNSLQMPRRYIAEAEIANEGWQWSSDS